MSKLLEKVTGETAEELATKGVEKEINQIGNKTGEDIEEKVYDTLRKPIIKERKDAEIQKNNQHNTNDNH